MFPRSTLARYGVIIAAAALLTFGGYYAVSRNGQGETLPQQLGADDQEVLAQLKTILLLPDDVTPTMAIITDVEILKSRQPAFFADAKNGDRLILYPELAILYDERKHQIIKIGPVQSVQSEPRADMTKP